MFREQLVTDGREGLAADRESGSEIVRLQPDLIDGDMVLIERRRQFVERDGRDECVHHVIADRSGRHRRNLWVDGRILLPTPREDERGEGEKEDGRRQREQNGKLPHAAPLWLCPDLDRGR